jgi:hypothetical protein
VGLAVMVAMPSGSDRSLDRGTRGDLSGTVSFLASLAVFPVVFAKA